MNRRSRRQERSVRLLLEIVVGALDIFFGEGIVGGAIDMDCPGGCEHAALGDTWAAGKHEYLVGRGVERVVCPGLRPFAGNLAVIVSNTSLLDDRRNPSLWEKRSVQRLAGAHPVRQSRSQVHDLR